MVKIVKYTNMWEGTRGLIAAILRSDLLLLLV